jgi:ATP adenylyltransferase
MATAGDDSVACVFCRILASGEPDDATHIVWRGDHVFGILNAYPYTSGHLMVMPYRHVGALDELTADEGAALWGAVVDAEAALRAAYSPEGVNIGINLGRAAGAGVLGHLHVHGVPRWLGDSNFMTAVAETRVLPESLDVSAEKIRKAWPAR